MTILAILASARKWLGKLTDALLIGRSAGWWNRGPKGPGA
jgi:hypothetical protein